MLFYSKQSLKVCQRDMKHPVGCKYRIVNNKQYPEMIKVEVVWDIGSRNGFLLQADCRDHGALCFLLKVKAQ